MQLKGKLLETSRETRSLIVLYLVITSIGFLSALQFVDRTTSGTPKGIQENYLGNEEDLQATELKFAMSERQILNIIHAHMLSIGMLFFILALLVATTPLGGILRKLLLFEPLVSVFLTFGGIYWLWKGILWMRYVVMLSGILMTLSYILSIVVLGYWLFKRN
ncbi:MAG: hypothetical protein AAF717_19525 [Bacteroidota bacterium]